MQEAVDKEEEDENGRRKVETRGLFLGFREANDDFAALCSGRVGEDIRDVRLPSRFHIYFLGFRRADEGERNLEGGKYGPGHFGKRQNRRFAPGLVGYINPPHRDYFFLRASFSAAGSILPSFTSSL